jgi:hypothetical protein
MKDKYNGMKKAADWKGKRVRAARQFRNGDGQGVTPGMLGTVMYVSRVGYHDIELVA